MAGRVGRGVLAAAQAQQALGGGIRLDAPAFAVAGDEQRGGRRLHQAFQLVRAALLAPLAVLQGAGETLLFGDLLDDDGHAQHGAVAVDDRVDAFAPYAAYMRLGRRRAFEHETEEGRAARHDLADAHFGGGGDVGNDVVDRFADVVLGRQAVDLGEQAVDAHVAQVEVQHGQSDRHVGERGFQGQDGAVRVQAVAPGVGQTLLLPSQQDGDDCRERHQHQQEFCTDNRHVGLRNTSMGVSQNIISFAKFLMYVHRSATLNEGSRNANLSICGNATSRLNSVTVILRISKICPINNNRLHQEERGGLCHF